MTNEAPRSLMDRAPKDLKIMWKGGSGERWTIRIEATIMDADHADSLREMIRILSDTSGPSALKDQPHDG